MGLSKKSKIWITVIVIPVILILVVIIGLKLYLTSERLANLVIPQIEKATKREVSISDISLSIFPTLGITVDDLKLSNPPAGIFERNDLVSVKNLKLKVDIFSLLGGKLDIKYIIIEKPSIYLEVAANGQTNYSMGEEPATEKVVVKDTVEPLTTYAFLLSNLEIKDGTVIYDNKQSGMRAALEGIQQIVRIESEGGEGKITINDSTYISKFSYGSSIWYLREQPLSISLNAGYDQSKDRLEINRLSLKLKDIPLLADGSISGLQGKSMNIDMMINSAGAEMAHLLTLIPPDFLQSAKGLSSSGKLDFSVSMVGAVNDSLTPGLKGSFKITDGQIHYKALPKSIKDINVDGSFEVPPSIQSKSGIGKFEISTLTANLGKSNIRGKLVSSNFNDPDILLTLITQMDLGEIKDFYPLEEGMELNGSLLCDISIQGKAKVPENMKAQGNIELKKVFIKSKNSPPLENLSGRIQFNNTRIEANNFSMKIGESDLSMSFVLRNYLGLVMNHKQVTSNIPVASLKLSSNVLKTKDIMGEDRSDKHENKTTRDTIAKSSLLPPINIDATINIKKLITDKFEFNNATGSLTLSEGIINLKNFSVDAFKGKILSNGMLDFRDQKKKPFNFELKIKDVESHEILSNFTSFGNNLFGQFDMSTTLKGDLDDTLGLNRKTLTGSGSLMVVNGKLVGFPLTAKLADLTNISELKEIVFQKWSNSFSIVNGQIEIKDLVVNAGTVDFVVQGTHSLDGVMNYALTVKLPPTISDRLKLPGVGSELIKFFKDKDNRINLNFAVTGETSNPRLSLDTRAQEEMAKKSLGDTAKKKLEEELKKKTQDGLKKLFKKPGMN